MPTPPTGSQDLISATAHAIGNSWQRDDLTEGTETSIGGNGATGHDETSENLSATWLEAVPTPGEGIPEPSAPRLLLTEIVVTPTAGEYVEIFNPSDVAADLSDVYLTDATFAGGGAFYYNIVTGANAAAAVSAIFTPAFPMARRSLRARPRPFRSAAPTTSSPPTASIRLRAL